MTGYWLVVDLHRKLLLNWTWRTPCNELRVWKWQWGLCPEHKCMPMFYMGDLCKTVNNTTPTKNPIFVLRSFVLSHKGYDCWPQISWVFVYEEKLVVKSSPVAELCPSGETDPQVMVIVYHKIAFSCVTLNFKIFILVLVGLVRNMSSNRGYTEHKFSSNQNTKMGHLWKSP